MTLTDRYASHGPLILVLNCGSSSIKFALFDAGQTPLPRQPVWNGKVQDIGCPCPTYGETGLPPEPVALGAERPYDDALQHILTRVQRRLGRRRLHSVVHRVVHGGNKYFAPVHIDDEILTDLKSYIPLAPLHQPFALDAMHTLLSSHPGLPQVACFDTAFHHTLPMVEQVLPLPYDAWERGLRRYGFHGLSYEYVATALPDHHGALADGRIIVAHLGSGASLCGLKGRRSVATTMGFSALDGLMMGTRTGSLDPGAVIYLMEIEQLTLSEVGRILYCESGLLGVSGLSSEPRVIVQHEQDDGPTGERARLALALYVRRIVREIGSLAAALGGLDMLVFTAGVGEHCAFIRERVCTELSWLGLRLDAAANARHDTVISTDNSQVRVAIEPTNEEWIAAEHARSCLAARDDDISSCA